MHFPRVVVISLVLGLIGLAGCGDNASPAPEATLESIAITPTVPTVAAGTSVQLVATGTYSDATTANLSSQVAWSLAETTVATISATGLLTGVAPGAVTITASLDGISGSGNAAITAAELTAIAVTPANPTLAAGTSTTLVATGTFSDASTQDLTSQVTWSSDNTAHVTVAATGTVTAVGVGPSTITAKRGSVVGTTIVTVSTAVLSSLAIVSDPPGPLTVPVGHALQLTAVATLSDGTKQVLGAEAHWAVEATAVATISATGLLATLTQGQATVTVTAGDLHAMATVTVTPAVLDSIEVTPATASVAAGLDQPFVAIPTFSDHTHPDVSAQLEWSVQDTAIATISSTGLVTTVKAGDTTVTAKVGSISGSATLHVTAAVITAIVVTPANPTVSLGGTRQFHATGQLTDGTTRDLPLVAWESSRPDFATIDATGLATSVSPGSTDITGTFEGISGTTTLKVTAAVLESITIAPADASVAKGVPQAFTATGNFSDGTHPDITGEVAWTSSDAAIATISTAGPSAGVASTHGEGTATISAALDGQTQSVTLQVTPAVLTRVVVLPLTASEIPGATQQYTATGLLTDDSSVPLTATATWSSDHPELATVSDTGASKGLVTGVAVGTATITATSGGLTGAATLVVLGPSVTTAVPASGATDVITSTSIAVSFNQPIDPATVTAQLADGPCTGSLQLSGTNFASCVGFAAQPTMNAAHTTATAVPAARLAPFANYKIRVLGTVANAAGVPIGVDVVQPIGFTTQGLCPARVVISQVYGGGGNNNSLFRNDFIELHNVGATPVSLDGFAIQFASAGINSAWAAQEIPAGTTVPGGGYFLIQEAAGAGMQALLPTPDFVPTTPVSGNVAGFAIGATSGKVALTPMTTVLTGTVCSALLPATTDLVGFGSAVSCFEGAAAAAPANPTAVLRNDDGCQDTDANNLDFSVRAPTPRNAAAPPVRCSCPGSTATN